MIKVPMYITDSCIKSKVWKGTNFVKMNGIKCPTCIASEDGPRPVYKKNGFPFSTVDNIKSRSLNEIN